MRAELKLIQTNDHGSWDEFVAAFLARSEAHGGWFSIEVGADDGCPDGEWFQVFVCTHASAVELKKKQGRSRYVVTPVFSPEGVMLALREHLSRVSGSSWGEVREALRKSMWWERETIDA